VITELWVWYDESEGDVPSDIKAMEVNSLFDLDFVNFYGWGETHEGWAGALPNSRFRNPAATRGMFFRPRTPAQMTVKQAAVLMHHPGVLEVEVKTIEYVGDSVVRKRCLSEMSEFRKDRT
jgi:hypothetical protein